MMTARECLEAEYGLKSEYGQELLQAVLNEHAHELAEKIRADKTVTGQSEDQYALCYADLIDPEVQR
jgi:hypothetical protein